MDQKTKQEDDMSSKEDYPYAENMEVCPKCGADQIEGSSLTLQDKSLYQEMTCSNCPLEWTEIYDLARRFIPTSKGLKYIYDKKHEEATEL